MANDFSSTYIGLLRLEVLEDLERNPKSAEVLGIFKSKFINWCAKERYEYEKDLEDEIKTFREKFIDARLYNTDVKLWKKISKSVMRRDKYTCTYCCAVGGILEVDHIVPISKNGSNEMSNLTTSCRKCNRQKKDKEVEEFISWRLENG